MREKYFLMRGEIYKVDTPIFGMWTSLLQNMLKILPENTPLAPPCSKGKDLGDDPPSPHYKVGPLFIAFWIYYEKDFKTFFFKN